MQSALSLPRETQMPDPTDRESRAPTVQTGIWIEEHGWLHRLFKSQENTSPRFRFPDLLGACVSLALRDIPSQDRLIGYLATQLTLRNPRTERRSCEIWAAQFDLLMTAHRAPWNRFPNPMFELDQLTTACVAVAMSLPDGDAQVLGQARLNLRERTSRSRGPEC
jgi:hypothetical protein